MSRIRRCLPLLGAVVVLPACGGSDAPASPDATPGAWGGELTPAPWTAAQAAPLTPDEAVDLAQGATTGARVAPPAIGTGELPPAPWMPVTPPSAPVAAPAPANVVVSTYVRAPDPRALPPRAVPPASGRRQPRTFADLGEGVLNGRPFGSLREFAVAAVVEGRFPVGAVARVFRLPAWRLEQWIVETGQVAR
ncbi:hypothetical protein [Microbacterium trichothecenolyticum]|uniref:Uncharacterized protein n=1 Tax=Microbacterium trichothecenolyticum TaxID=69370 RepID=A0ABU0TUE0_MICTR|nr:hypothetical protein [Microbacterium trichothecenolyticum]MDQ1123281.1 hypothetical protein [Microbacterium trichothecenolyticum]